MAADEFVIVFPPGVRLREAKLVARRLAKSLEDPFTVGDDAIHLTVSVGLAMSTLGRENTDTLLQRADTAMFRAKAAGRDRVEVYDERLRTRAVKRLEIDRELRVALERGELQLYYQPEIDCRTRRIVGAEALLRWQHRSRGLIQPEGFINVAEESGIIVPIGHWVLDEAVRQARTWTDAHPWIKPFAISVNLSARQLINRSLVDTVAFVLTRYDWAPSNLTLELTESILIEDRDATLYVLNRLRMLGVKLAIDDFGTGFASLDYLHRLHVDWIKIDRSFVELLDGEGNGSPVASAMMHMARAFELGVIAEGVEEQRQLEGLRTLGCDLVQGFLFAKPLPPDGFERLLARHR
jgi:EAL domain-containing protein (putative c-di-GMP-specific phosphodiesterase class I)